MMMITTKNNFRFLLSLVLFCYLLIPGTIVFAENESAIKTSPDKELFNLTNMKPGDSYTKILTIQNRSEKQFKYYSQVTFKAGSEKLFNALNLSVSDSLGELYKGNLKDFHGFEPRYLRSFSQEDLMFNIEFPSELGNEYQGLSTEIEFVFTKNDIIDPTPDPEDPKNPDSPGNPDTPENPDNPGNPDNPSNPENPEQPTNPGAPGNPPTNDSIKPPRPIDKVDIPAKPVQGQILPSTATNYFNLIFLGISLILIGVGFKFYKRSKF